MRRSQRGFGVLEAMLALAIGLMLLAAAGELFISAHQAWRLQGAAARLQDDARVALLHMAQDIRMAGMFGCLRLGPSDFKDPATREAFARPLEVSRSELSVVVWEMPGQEGKPDWTLQTDCLKTVQIDSGLVERNESLWSYSISRHAYQLTGTTLRFKRGSKNNFQPLIDHVHEIRFEHVRALGGERVDIVLTLFDPVVDIKQHYEMSVAIRNPVPEP